MYQNYFGLKSTPFSIVPDHRVVYMSDSHRDAVAHLLYSVKQSGGFVQLTGEVGTGKTTVSRYLLQHLPKSVNVALLLNPRINEKEMIETICDELEISYPDAATQKQLITALNKYLLTSHAKGRHTVLIIDEAQNLSREVLEQIRLLTNLETSTDKLLQIILIGQPELVKILGRHDLRQLSQRIVGRLELMPLNLKETREYVRYRLRQAGCQRPLFASAAIKLVHKLSGGVPRIINVLCDSALMGAYSTDEDTVGKKAVQIAAREVLPKQLPSRFLSKEWSAYAVAASVFAVLFVGLQSTSALPKAMTAMKTMAMQVLSEKPVAHPTDSESIGELTAAAGGLAGDLSISALVTPALTNNNTSGGSVVSGSTTNSITDRASGQSLLKRSSPEALSEKSNPSSSRYDLIYRLGVPYRNN